MNASRISIGHLTLSQRLGCLEDRHGNMCHLRPKSYRVLEILAEHRGALVSKDDLIAGAWNGSVVTDESLSQCISDIRRALGKDDAKLLRTVPRRGYVLEAEAEAEILSNPASPAWVVRAVVSVAITAVLSISLFVTTMSPKATYMATQEVADSHDAPRVDPRGQDWRERDANDALRAELQDTLVSDPRNADAWAQLGVTFWLEVKHSAWGGGRRELALSLSALERSLLLGGGALAYRTLAEVRLDAPFRDARSVVDALAAAQAAIHLDPVDPNAQMILADALLANGHAEDAIPLIEQPLAALATPPDRYREIAGLIYLVAGESSKAVEEFGRLHGAGTFSGMRDYTGWFLAASLAHAGRIDEASTVVRQARISRPERTLQGVAVSLNRLADKGALDTVLDGLRLAGMPG
ncbi:winged helix-turn-helix domain-containing protein [Granulosicoccus sp. 3-233]|uniref:winged helix-turn-helix domain-containing protein n=1 Tax=Granulosicoccus sp. 3-233 TaxID=3417969 RepID=UPI003D340312